MLERIADNRNPELILRWEGLRYLINFEFFPIFIAYNDQQIYLKLETTQQSLICVYFLMKVFCSTASTSYYIFNKQQRALITTN